jgi:hypothetical protein
VLVNEPWFSVRCVFAFEADHGTNYEERVTLWHASSFEEAIERAEQEAREYAEELDARYVGLAQAFHLFVEDRPLGDGDEVFSLIRESELAPDDYISRFFDTGKERQREAE